MLLWLSAERAAGQSFMQAHFKMEVPVHWFP